jgi:hypothetical protein
MDILFRCGHAQPVDPDRTPSPVCGQCGDTVIARALNVRAPRFTGTVTGPHAETTALQAIAVSLLPKDAKPLTLKPDTFGEQKESKRAH